MISYQHRRLASALTLIVALPAIGGMASADPPQPAPAGPSWCDVNFAPLAANFPENTARRNADDSAQRVQPATYVGGEPVIVPGPPMNTLPANVEPGTMPSSGIVFPAGTPPPAYTDATFAPNTPPLPRRIAVTAADGTTWDLGFLARGYYINDQRIQWSGMEATFATEGILASSIKHTYGFWETSIEGQFYLNQPYGPNMLEDNAERQSYAADFEIPPFEIDQLYVRCRNGDWSLLVGKFPTPFGRTYFLIDTNSHVDAPFIRTESIGWRETGALLHYEPGWFVADFAVTNGDPDRADNSSKFVVGRAGLQGENYAVGASVKWGDGVGSDGQKEYDNHAGVDAMYRFGRFTLSGEAIYDQYGFKHPGFDPDDIFWGRSIYYRDLYNPSGGPITGVGYYLDLGYREERWYLGLNYGEFYPEYIGNPLQDVNIRRGLLKFNYWFTPQLQSFNMLLLETSGQIAQLGLPRNGVAVLTGLQFTF